MSSLIVALISFAIAFCAGALLSKAFFATQATPRDAIAREEHHALLKAQRSRYRKRVHALSNVVGLHEDTQGKIKEKLAEYHREMEARAEACRAANAEVAKLRAELAGLQSTTTTNDGDVQELSARIQSLSAELEAEHAKSADAANQLGLLRIEREELNARVQRLEQAQHVSDRTKGHSTSSSDAPAAEMRAGMGELREKLAMRDRHLHELKVKLQDSEEQKQHAQQRLDTLKQRVSPLTQKLRQQRQLIRQLREVSTQLLTRDADANEQQDDLKAIHGIGPALERRLRSHGIERFEQIAAMSEQEFAAVATRLSIAPTMAQRQGWIQQARDLYRGLDSSS